MDLEVVKKDGSIERFDESKIARVTNAAGLPETQSQEVAEKVAEDLKNLNLSKIQTIEIRAKVIEELHKANEQVAQAYLWYEQTKDEGLNSG